MRRTHCFTHVGTVLKIYRYLSGIYHFLINFGVVWYATNSGMVLLTTQHIWILHRWASRYTESCLHALPVRVVTQILKLLFLVKVCAPIP